MQVNASQRPLHNVLTDIRAEESRHYPHRVGIIQVLTSKINLLQEFSFVIALVPLSKHSLSTSINRLNFIFTRAQRYSPRWLRDISTLSPRHIHPIIILQYQ